MTEARLPPDLARAMAPAMPRWLQGGRAGPAQTLEEAAFLSGAALAHLSAVAAREDLPAALWRARLGLRAAEACMVFAGRPERTPELRDALHLTRPGDLLGPAGEIAESWRRAVARPVSAAALQRAVPGLAPERIAAALAAGQGAPVARSAAVLEAALQAAPRGEGPALILAEAALARALGLDHLVPVLAPGLARADLALRGEALRLACHRAVRAGAVQAVVLAADLAPRAAHLRAVAPKLRARAAAQAVAEFLSCDAMAPAELPLPDRAARRLCDRLVGLGALRELTGRDSFRLYGL